MRVLVIEDEPGVASISAADLVIKWEDVTKTVDGGTVTISGYEIIITKVEHDDPNGFSRPIYDVHLPPRPNSLAVPVEFLEPDTLYEMEVLALEETGNQKVTFGFLTNESRASSANTIPYNRSTNAI